MKLFWMFATILGIFLIVPHVHAADIDTDGDGLSDVMETAFQSNPASSDTDGDGYIDGSEVLAGYSPTSSVPVPLPKEIRITLSKQQMEQRLGGITIATYQVSTGMPGMSTPVGTYKVLSKHPRAWSRSARLWMPWWMAFTTRGHGIHELPEWPGGKKEGVDHLGKPVSHGCVRLGIGPAQAMYDWAPIGTPVIIVR